MRSIVSNQKLLWGGLGLLVISACCVGVLLGSVLAKQNPSSPSQPTPSGAVVVSPVVIFVPEPTNTPPLLGIADTPPPLPAEPPTIVPTFPLDALPPAQQPTVNLNDLAQYAQAIKPILEESLAAAKRDNAVLEVIKENPAAICGQGLTPHPTLAADAALMKNLANRLDSIIPPAEVAELVHQPLVESIHLWRDALKNINLSCQTDDPTGQNLLRLGAMLQLGSSLVNFQTASTNFWRLAIAKGLEEIVGSLPIGTPVSP
ncbi:MAG: hypothetical protein JXM69_13860 [Anaerolineae bacterium]|nr:hypothetical protein [Anaerolineae bacterium]